MTRSRGGAAAAAAACALALAAVIPLVVNRSQAPPQIAAPLPSFLLVPESPPGAQPPATSATSPASPLPLPLTPPGILLLLALPPPAP